MHVVSMEFLCNVWCFCARAQQVFLKQVICVEDLLHALLHALDGDGVRLQRVDIHRTVEASLA